MKRMPLLIPLSVEPHGSIDPRLVNLIEQDFDFRRVYDDGRPYYNLPDGWTLKLREEPDNHQIVDIVHPDGEVRLTVHRFISNYTKDYTVIVKGSVVKDDGLLGSE